MFERMSLVIYYRTPKVLKNLKKFGHVAYYHKKRRYAILYINAPDETTIINALQKNRQIRKIERSELDTEAYNLSQDVK